MSIPNADGSSQLIVAHQGLGNDGQLWATSPFKDAKQTGDQQVPNTGMSGSPALLVWGGGLYVFHQGFGNDGQLWCNSNDGYHGWSGDQQVPNTGMSGSPAAAVYPGSGSFMPYVFHQGPGNDGQLWYTRHDGSSWTGDQQVPNVGMSGSPTAAVYGGGPGLLYVFHQGSGNDGQLWYTSSNGSSWTGDQQVPNTGMSGSPAVAVFHNLLYVFHQGSGNDGQLWYTSYNGSSWTGDQQVPNTGMSESPALVVFGVNLAQNDTLYAFHQGPGNDGQLWLNSYNGISWTGDRQVPNVGMSGSPALAVYPPPDSGPGDDAGGGGFPPEEGDEHADPD